MSRRLPLILMALTSFFAFPGSFRASQSESIADLLLNDDIDKAEAVLSKQPHTAQAVAFRGEIEFRKGDFTKAENSYREALRMDPKTGRAHFGLGRLALAKLKTKDAFAGFKRAIE